ncbi:MAG: hypothetical protein ACTSX9_09465 [Candidatus Njordarchaeales archaeon]
MHREKTRQMIASRETEKALKRLIMRYPELEIASRMLGYISLNDFIKDLEAIIENPSLNDILKVTLKSLGEDPRGSRSELLEKLRKIIKKSVERNRLISAYAIES